ncbi:MAG: DNA polymerase III subunit beta [Clostridia bacterium]|nr:DNA polymerase III subunit beta [Clostridia bacterium]
MKLICQGADLSDAVLKVVKACAGKSVVPVLECIKLTAKNDILSLLATDTELSIEKVIKADVLEEGELCIPGKYFSDFINKIEDEEITLTTCARGLEIKYGDAVSFMQVLPPDDFPRIDISVGENNFVMAQSAFRSLISKVAFCAATDDSRPILKGCLLEIGEREIVATALDGYRMAVAREKILSASQPKRIIVPARTLGEINKMISGDESELKIFIQKGMMMVEVEDTILTSRLYTGEFVNSASIMPKEFSTYVEVSGKELEESIERAAILVRTDKNSLIIFDIKGSSVGVSSNSDIGGVSEVVRANVNGPELKIAMNSKYILEAVKAIGESVVRIQLNTSVAPFIVYGEEKEKCKYLILPVRANS